MKRAIVAALIVVCALASPARERAVRGPRQPFYHAFPSHPMAGWPAQPLADAATGRVGTPISSLVWKVRLVTQPNRPWTDAGWLSAHSRLEAGILRVPVWRSSNGLFCQTQMLSVPAQPNQVAEHVLDMSFFTGPEDSVMFEIWPGYDVYLQAYDGGKRVLEVYTIWEQRPGSTQHPARYQRFDNVGKCVVVTVP